MRAGQDNLSLAIFYCLDMTEFQRFEEFEALLYIHCYLLTGHLVGRGK